jgi:pimeloyl-ACP methyl ester carboxylesterase
MQNVMNSALTKSLKAFVLGEGKRDSSHEPAEHSSPPSSDDNEPSLDQQSSSSTHRRMSVDDAGCIIGGRPVSVRDNRQAQNVFSFSLPFSNPLASFELPSLDLSNFMFGTKPNDGDYGSSEIAEIDSDEEEARFGGVRHQDNSRLRAVTTSLSRSFTMPITSRPFPEISGDVVILGGYRGSILRDRKSGRRIWIPIKVGFNIRKIDLTVGIRDEDELEMEDSIYPSGMLTNIGPVDISGKLIRKLASQKNCRVHEFGYDWRLSSDINSKKLVQFVQKIVAKHKSGKRGVFVIAHSMGGLIAHHAMQTEPQLFRGVVYAGVPSACPNILGPLRYGDSVLFSSKVLTAKVNFLMRSSFVLLPLNGQCFVDAYDESKRYDLDFFDPKIWVEYGLSPYVIGSSTMVQDPSAVDQDMSSEQALEYLDRTLQRTKKFLLELKPKDGVQYPPLAILYGSTLPTLKGAKVNGLQGIKDGDYDHLIFGAGDGVVYRKSLMPEQYGFKVAAKVPSSCSHVTLLTDIEAVGRALEALLDEEARRDLVPKRALTTI